MGLLKRSDVAGSDVTPNPSVMRQNRAVNGSEVAAWVSAVGALVGAVAAIAAWRAADASARVSRHLSAIEAARRHQELTPLIAWRIEPRGLGSPVYHLTLELEGPLSLKKLSRLTVRIRDDRPGRDQELHSIIGKALTLEQVRQQVWGPVRFTPGVGPGLDRADSDGRSVSVTVPLKVGEGLRFQLEATRHPWHWRTDAVADADWVAMVGTRLRLSLEAFADESEVDSWTMPYEVDVPDRSNAGR